MHFFLIREGASLSQLLMPLFHTMGIIRIVAPHDKINDSLQTIPRLKEIPSVAELTVNTQIPIKIYDNRSVQGLKKIIVEKLDFSPIIISSLRNSDVLWIYAKYKEVQQIPGWSGFMEMLTQHEEHYKPRVMYLPFINSPANNYNTIYTTLLYVLEDSRKYGHATCIITFDQPLYIKAKEIVASSAENSGISKIVVRLGGFHMCMSFLGSIGFIMAGSGLKEVLNTIFASNSVDKMLTGHAYSRAVRGYTLLLIALSKIIFSEMNLSGVEQEFLDAYLNEWHEATPSVSKVEELKILINVKKKYQNKCLELKERGPTSKLWIQYLDMVLILKEFIRAERMEDWKAYLSEIKRMIPYFYATGHFLYAKSAQLFIQDMENLENTMDKDTFKKFTGDFFTIKRSEKFFSGTSSDMVIEQTLMKSSKMQGGFVHGRSTKESVLTKFVLGLLSASNISEGLENFCGLNFASAEQHADARESRIKRDQEDVKKLAKWFSSHNPFPSVQAIMSIATGVTGNVEKINCYNALSIGAAMMEKKVGDNFHDVKYSRTDRVLSLKTVNTYVTVHDVIVPVDPFLLFQRFSIIKRSDDDLRECLNFELAPYPVALFDENGMRKTKKSSLFDIFNPININLDFETASYIIDGGFLLHRVIWQQNDSFLKICNKYVSYVQNNYGQNSVVVFDGYSNQRNVKAMEQLRRCSKASSTEILFDENMIETLDQEKFLTNGKNKSRLIGLLTNKFKDAGISVKQADNDADVLIVETALEISEAHNNSTVIVGEDIDLLVILTARTPLNLEIFFLKPGKGKIEQKIYSSKSLEGNAGKDDILFLHAFSGCDGTSAIFQKGKLAVVKLLQKRPDLRNAIEVFNQCNVSHSEIIEKGTKFILGLYGATKNETSLNDYRYRYFTKAVTKNKAVKLSTIPPTLKAAKQHLFRVYYHVQTWLGNELNPEKWGWDLIHDVLVPIRTMQPPAPDSLLNMIFCLCYKGCGSACGCRKLGLYCSIACANCQGQSCLNAAPTEGISETETIMDTEEVCATNETDFM